MHGFSPYIDIGPYLRIVQKRLQNHFQACIFAQVEFKAKHNTDLNMHLIEVGYRFYSEGQLMLVEELK